MNPSFPRMHVSLYVTDISKTTAFYDRFFGQAPSKVQHRYAKYELAEPGLIISFVENPERVAGHFGHLGIQVGTQEELQRRHAIAKAENIVSHEEIGVSCCYAVQDKFWATDPDGHQWEVYYFHADVTFNDPAYDLVANKTAVATKTSSAIALATVSEKKVASSCTPGGNCC